MKLGLSFVRAQEVLSYDPESGLLRWKISGRSMKTGDVCAQSPNGKGYLFVRVDRVSYLQHRVAWLLMTGIWASNQIDHKNGRRSDNRLSNLRVVSREWNCQNRIVANRKSKTGLLGVIVHKKRFRAAIKVDGRLVRLGSFDTAMEAHLAYMQAKQKFHPGFARTIGS